MIRIEMGDTSFRIPDNWGDIRLGDYEKWFNQSPDNKLDYIKFVADICKIDVNLLINSPAQLFDIISQSTEFVFNTEVTPSNKVRIEGNDYYIAPSDKLTLGEWVDIESTIESDSETKISEILAVICRPAGEAYDIEKMELRKAMFRNLTCEKALPLIAFFLRRKKESEMISNLYLEIQTQATQFLKDTKTFAQNGGGIKQLPIWQRIRYTYLTRSLEKQLSKFSDFYSTGQTRRELRRSNTNLKNK